MKPSHTCTYRLIMIGNSFVGKTALVMRYINKKSQESYDETIGAAFHSFTLNLDNETVNVQIWDTAGQEKYRSSGPVYFRNANAAILVYDSTDRHTFIDLPQWLDTFRETAGQQALITIVGNKIDLDDKIKVDQNEGQQFANENNLSFVATSALTGYNVDYLFQSVVEQIHNDGITPHTNRKKEKLIKIQDGEQKSCC
ncbi:small GTP-binding protein [Tritrichomonas foetus]|uniref:Small GTP-binding protein n=1 Tax=Tritrichomonas foetus TaxID=1144522 RepID=A0A1J4KMM5_9EUKA|nr:small GTP-binding protein [Tritrichomonas foetus]|eukprot:OHT11044.1 small GTP-binding protein [Tritrichomonas foetus]